MEFITENQIDEAVQFLENEENGAKAFDAMNEQQPFFCAYLYSDTTSGLTDKEKEYLLYLALVIWKASDTQTELDVFETHILEETEEINWNMMLEMKGDFRERLTPFFENYPQEDLLAFVEDGLVMDEDEKWLTEEGRDLIFVILRTFIDCLFEL